MLGIAARPGGSCLPRRHRLSLSAVNKTVSYANRSRVSVPVTRYLWWTVKKENFLLVWFDHHATFGCFVSYPVYTRVPKIWERWESARPGRGRD